MDMSSEETSDAVTEHNLNILQVYSKPDDYESTDSESEVDYSAENLSSAFVHSSGEDCHQIYENLDHQQPHNTGYETCADNMIGLSQDVSNESIANMMEVQSDFSTESLFTE